MDTIGKRLRILREKKGLSVSEVAQAIGIPVSTYREWEYGRAVRGDAYLPLAQALSVSLIELLTGKKPQRENLISEIEEIERRVSALKRNMNLQL